MSIIISRNGGKAVTVDRSSFDKEDYLQQYIYQNPESIPLSQIKENVRLLILAREIVTNSGQIDALGIDREGDIYIIETKLYKNPDKRVVIAQALDYGAALWKHSNDFGEFINMLDNHTQKAFSISAHEKIKEFFELSDEDVDDLVENARRSLNDGKFKFVVLMDKLDDRLRDLILFVNQNSQFDIFSVELAYYKYGEFEITIPSLYGAEVKKDINVTQSSQERRKWSKISVVENFKEHYTNDAFRAFEKIFDFCEENADQINFGTGRHASFSPIFLTVSKKSLFTISSDGRLIFNFEWVAKDNPQSADILKDVAKNSGFDIPENYREIRPNYALDKWAPKADDFIANLSKVCTK